MKNLEGKDVFLIPIGNNARDRKDKYIKGHMLKVARVFATIKHNYGREEKLRFDGNRLTDDYNSGYLVFPSEDGVNEHYERINLKNKISEKFAYPYRIKGFNLDQLRRINAILEE